jgi:hypothetical protein
MAMAEASKLFDKSGATSGTKQDAINGAAMTVMKLLVQSKFSGGTVGGGDSGGLGGLMSMVSFLCRSGIYVCLTTHLRRRNSCEESTRVPLRIRLVA